MVTGFEKSGNHPEVILDRAGHGTESVDLELAQIDDPIGFPNGLDDLETLDQASLGKRHNFLGCVGVDPGAASFGRCLHPGGLINALQDLTGKAIPAARAVDDEGPGAGPNEYPAIASATAGGVVTASSGKALRSRFTFSATRSLEAAKAATPPI